MDAGVGIADARALDDDRADLFCVVHHGRLRHDGIGVKGGALVADVTAQQVRGKCIAPRPLALRTSFLVDEICERRHRTNAPRELVEGCSERALGEILHAALLRDADRPVNGLTLRVGR